VRECFKAERPGMREAVPSGTGARTASFSRASQSSAWWRWLRSAKGGSRSFGTIMTIISLLLLYSANPELGWP
jgi:hypothetical protein